jgi:hypothetical protein
VSRKTMYETWHTLTERAMSEVCVLRLGEF